MCAHLQFLSTWSRIDSKGEEEYQRSRGHGPRKEVDMGPIKAVKEVVMGPVKDVGMGSAKEVNISEREANCMELLPKQRRYHGRGGHIC